MKAKFENLKKGDIIADGRRFYLFEEFKGNRYAIFTELRHEKGEYQKVKGFVLFPDCEIEKFDIIKGAEI